MLGWYLTIVCNDTKVRKTSQAALLVLLEQGLVEKSDVEEQVWIKHFFLFFLYERSWADFKNIDDIVTPLDYIQRNPFINSFIFNSSFKPYSNSERVPLIFLSLLNMFRRHSLQNIKFKLHCISTEKVFFSY